MADPVARISEVQGSGAASQVVGSQVTIEAIVVGDFQNGDADARRDLGGFHLQEEGSFAQRYVKRHELAQPFQADFEGLSGYVRGNIGSVRSSQS